MSVRVASVAIALWAIAASSAVASSALAVVGLDTEAEHAAVETNTNQFKTEERSLADLATGMDAFVLSPTRNETAIRFNLPPGTDASEAWLRLAARPASDTTDGRINVSVNGGDPITIRPQPRAMEARFALFSDDFRAGENVLTVSYEAVSASAGWIVDAQRSRLRLSFEHSGAITDLSSLESALSSDFAAPRRVALVTDVSRERATLESLVAQGVALRAGAVPLFTGDADNADLVIRIAENGRLAEDDLAALNENARSAGPEIAFRGGETPRLVITGRNIDETSAAARLFAARSFAGYERVFLASDAISAERLGQPQARDARYMAQNASLQTFATSGLPFSADQGSRTAVQLSGQHDADRYGALSVLARAALTGGEAWLYAWYGEAHDEMPVDHNLLIIGPQADTLATIDRNAPAELRAALRAAERNRGQRGLMRLAAAAYADDGDNMPSSENIVNVGVASLFMDQDQPGRWIGTLTAPDLASFESAGRSLARSDLWHALEGRAAIWSERGVTALDYSIVAPSLTQRAQEFATDHMRDAAFILFGFATLMLFRSLRRRRVKASAEAGN